MKLIYMALRARVLERVACQTGTLVEHCRDRMRSGFEQRQRHMAAGKLIMAGAAVLRTVTCGTSSAVQGRDLSMDIVFKPRCMRLRPHDCMAAIALVPRRH